MALKYPIWYLSLRTWWRLRFGICPLCNSSPPLKDCKVCDGTFKYGRYVPEFEQNKVLWKARFKWWLDKYGS